MKKFVLVMACMPLLVIFIALNYLLWDRENKEKDIRDLEYSKASSNASINALGREIKALEDENQALREKLEEADKKFKELEAYRDRLEKEKDEINKTLLHKVDVINRLKQEVDPKVLEAPVRKWIESIDAGDYESAYDIQTSEFIEKMGFSDLADFRKGCESSIKNIKLKSIKLYTEPTRSNTTADILFLTTLEVKKAEGGNTGKIQFDEGLNERFFAINYNKERNMWMVSDIFVAH